VDLSGNGLRLAQLVHNGQQLSLMAGCWRDCPGQVEPGTAAWQHWVIDVLRDPGAKTRLVSGRLNFFQCPSCGFQGTLATPLVYHDPVKELLLTYLPPDLRLNPIDQEKAIGDLIQQVVNSLAPEQRKGYLLRPQAVLTAQGLVERVLEADGVTLMPLIIVSVVVAYVASARLTPLPESGADAGAGRDTDTCGGADTHAGVHRDTCGGADTHARARSSRDSNARDGRGFLTPIAAARRPAERPSRPLESGRAGVAGC